MSLCEIDLEPEGGGPPIETATFDGGRRGGKQQQRASSSDGYILPLHLRLPPMPAAAPAEGRDTLGSLAELYDEHDEVVKEYNYIAGNATEYVKAEWHGCLVNQIIAGYKDVRSLHNQRGIERPKDDAGGKVR